MNRYVVSLVVLGAVPILSTRAAAQHGAPAISTRVTPYVGFLSSGSIAQGPYGSTLSMRGTAMFGAQLGLDLTANLALVGNVGYANSDLEAGMPLIGGWNVADSKVLMYDGGIQLRFPAVTRAGTGLVPYLEGGIGAMHHDLRSGSLTTQSTNVAVIAGGGMDVQLSRAIGFRLMARDHMSRFDYGDAIGVANEGRRAHNWIVGVGLTLGM